MINLKKVGYKVLNMLSGVDSSDNKAEKVIERHTTLAMGGGFIPLPFFDVVAVTAIQVNLIRSLCDVYDLEFSEQNVKAYIAALAGGVGSRMGASTISKSIPVVGTLVGGAAMSVISGATTYALGRVFNRHFQNGGNLTNFDYRKFKSSFRDLFEKAEEDLAAHVAEDNEELSADQIVHQIRELTQLKKEGHISEEEYEKLKKALLE